MSEKASEKIPKVCEGCGHYGETGCEVCAFGVKRNMNSKNLYQ